MSEALKPCPFCGSTKVDAEGWSSLEQYRGTDQWRSGPACDDCSGSADSVEQWNTRAPDPEAASLAISSRLEWRHRAETAERLLSEAMEKAAGWHDDQATLLMGSLHCGDNATTIQMTRVKADWHTDAARQLRKVPCDSAAIRSSAPGGN